MKKRHAPQRGGFTMLEMLVAMAITVGIVLFINQVFTSVSDAVRGGLGTSRVLQHARVIRAQLTNDAVSMVGPSDNGFLIIANKKYTGVKLSQDAAQTVAVASDQLCFASLAGPDMEPITPGNQNSISTTSDAPYVKIWYGHCRHVKPDGTDSLDMTVAGGLNEYPVNWVLGRQALFLEDDSTAPFVYSQGAKYNATVNGTSAPIAKNLYMGLTDVSGNVTPGNSALVDLSNQIVTAPATAMDLIYVKERLRVNAQPVYNPSAGRDYAAWQIAQTHPYFIPQSLSFEVEVAGDWYDETAGAKGQDGKIDLDGKGQIIWYSKRNTFYISRIESDYSAGNNANADRVLVWKANTPAAQWPYLVRLTYRITDENARVSSRAGLGRTFEIILPVNRS